MASVSFVRRSRVMSGPIVPSSSSVATPWRQPVWCRPLVVRRPLRPVAAAARSTKPTPASRSRPRLRTSSSTLQKGSPPSSHWLAQMPLIACRSSGCARKTATTKLPPSKHQPPATSARCHAKTSGAPTRQLSSGPRLSCPPRQV